MVIFKNTKQQKRYERKFQFLLGYEDAINTFLRCEKFREIYKMREINSLYYDDFTFTNYSDSEEGINKRSKIRARYYDDGKEGFNLEHKIKQDNLNWKVFQNNQSIMGCQLLPIKESFSRLKSDILLPSTINNIYTPKVFITYLRKYFLSKDDSLRITIDYKIRYGGASKSSNYINVQNPRENLYNVLELKYNNSISLEEVFIKKLCHEFNFNLSRSSKYCEAVRNIFS